MKQKIMLKTGVMVDHDSFYSEFTSRNYHFIDSQTQQRLRKLKILIAGCGSTGGACIEALARAGVENIYLADNGEYEISNLNRQHFRLENVGQNKAEFHREEILNINPFIDCKVFSKGIQANNVEELCQWADFIFDAVDVTSESGMSSKIDLHINAKKYAKPVASALDLGFKQWGMSFDYRNRGLEVFAGKLKKIQACKNPIKALFSIYPLEAIPSHSYQLFFDLLSNRKDYASQIGCTSDLLSGIIVPVIIRFAKDGHLSQGWSIDQSNISLTLHEKIINIVQYLPRKKKLKNILKNVS